MPKIVKEKIVKEEIDSLHKLYKDLNEQYGPGTIIGGKGPEEDVSSIDSGSLTLNIATSIGGIPRGRLIEMLGPESSGKSTLALHFITEFQKADRMCAICDAEQSFDRKYATALGVNVDNLIFIEPENMEAGYNIVQKLIESKKFGLIVIDSHTALLPKKIIEGVVGDATIGLQARLNSTFLGKVHPMLRKNDCTIVAISQLRTNIGGWGDPRIATGGLAYKFYADMRLKVSKKIDKDKEQNETVVEVIKSKCGAPFGEASFMIGWGTGIDRMLELINLAVEYGFLHLGGGGWYTIVEGVKVQGNDQLKAYLRDNPEYTKELEEKVLAKIKEECERKREK